MSHIRSTKNLGKYTASEELPLKRIKTAVRVDNSPTEASERRSKNLC